MKLEENIEKTKLLFSMKGNITNDNSSEDAQSSGDSLSNLPSDDEWHLLQWQNVRSK